MKQHPELQSFSHPHDETQRREVCVLKINSRKKEGEGDDCSEMVGVLELQVLLSNIVVG